MRFTIFFFLWFFILCKNCFSQVETPEIKYITIDSVSNHVKIFFSVNNPDLIDGFGIKRLIVDGQGVVSGTYNSVMILDKSNCCMFTDTTTVYQTQAKPLQRPENYTVSAFRKENNQLVYSNMSNAHQTIFLTVHYNECKYRNELKWTQYIGWQVLKYHIVVKDLNTKKIIKLAENKNTDTVFYHKLPSGINNFEYFIIAENNENIQSVSNKVIIKTEVPILPTSTFPKIASVYPNNNINLIFNIIPNTEIKQYKLIRYKFTENKTDTIHTFNYLPVFSWNDSTDTEKKYLYKITGKNKCSENMDITFFAGNIVLQSDFNINFNVSEVTFNWNKYNFWENGVLRYELLEKNNYTEYKTIAEINSADSVFKYPLTDANFLSSTHLFRIKAINKSNNNVYAYSNELIISPNTKLFLPNAIYLNSTNEENREFKIKTASIKHFRLTIYNRWGNVVFISENAENSWKGKDLKGNQLPAGTYTYVLKIIHEDNSLTEKNGIIHLIFD